MKFTNKEFSKKLRQNILKMCYKAQTAHLASSLSCSDIVSVIYNSIIDIKKIKKNDFKRDRFILSKGHAAMTLYSALYLKKIIQKKDFQSYCKNNSLFEEHPSIHIKGVEATTGSLGHGLSIANGFALSSKILGKKFRSFVLMSDGECNEGSVWEAVMFAAKKKLNNLCLIVDYNKWQATGRSNEIMQLEPLDKKFKYFGWDIKRIDGHNLIQIENALSKKNISEKPLAIIADTIKGKGVSFMEDDNNWHYKSPNKKQLIQALKEVS